jgi:hypothetical protein
LVPERRLTGRSTDALFVSLQRNCLTVASLSRLWQHWCGLAGLDGVYASAHGDLRVPAPRLAASTPRGPAEGARRRLPGPTLTYLSIQDEELSALIRRDAAQAAACRVFEFSILRLPKFGIASEVGNRDPLVILSYHVVFYDPFCKSIGLPKWPFTATVPSEGAAPPPCPPHPAVIA